MKIAFVIGLYPYQIGGAEMQALEIAKALKSEGHTIEYISYSPICYTSNDFKVHIIPERAGLDFFYYGIKKQLYRVLDEIKPDIIYHRAFVPYSRFVATWASINKVPFYFHCADIYTLNAKNNSLYNIVKNIWLKKTLKLATGVICQNIEQYRELQRFQIKKVKIIYNLHRKNINNRININNRNQIIWIGKFEPMKQPNIFIDFAEKYHDTNILFTMFSSKCPKTETNMKLLKRIANNNRITFIEGKDNDFINNYICNHALLLVNTSLSEGISNTFIQAWMRGVPVLSLNSNPDNWFDRYKIGFCCNGDADLLRVKAAEIISSGIYKEYSQQSISFAENHFALEVIVPEMIKFMNLT